jgi:hypothetical protein
MTPRYAPYDGKREDLFPMATTVVTQLGPEERDPQTKIHSATVLALREQIHAEIEREARDDARAWLEATPEERGPHDGDFAGDAIQCFGDALASAFEDPGWTYCNLLPLPLARTAYVAAYLNEVARAEAP